jgi:hypothetical protein
VYLQVDLTSPLRIVHSARELLPVLHPALDQHPETFGALAPEQVPQAGAVGQAAAANHADVDSRDLQAPRRRGELIATGRGILRASSWAKTRSMGGRPSQPKTRPAARPTASCRRSAPLSMLRANSARSSHPVRRWRLTRVFHVSSATYADALDNERSPTVLEDVEAELRSLVRSLTLSGSLRRGLRWALVLGRTPRRGALPRDLPRGLNSFRRSLSGSWDASCRSAAMLKTAYVWAVYPPLAEGPVVGLRSTPIHHVRSVRSRQMSNKDA